MAKIKNPPVLKPEEPKPKEVKKIIVCRNGDDFAIKPEALQEFLDAGWRKK